MGQRVPHYASPEEFIRVWQSSESLDAVASNFSVDKSVVSRRANSYRKRGVALKKFSERHSAEKWQKLSSLADSLITPASDEQT